RPRDLLQRDWVDASGRLRPDLWRRAVAHLRDMPLATGIRGPGRPGSFASLATPLAGRQWNQIGPQPLIIDPPPPNINTLFRGVGPDSGQCVDVDIDPRGPTDRVVYIATNGGVWKTTDGGLSWLPKTDYLDSPSIGCVTVDPFQSDTVYAGTGNPQHLS